MPIIETRNDLLQYFSQLVEYEKQILFREVVQQFIDRGARLDEIRIVTFSNIAEKREAVEWGHVRFVFSHELKGNIWAWRATPELRPY